MGFFRYSISAIVYSVIDEMVSQDINNSIQDRDRVAAFISSQHRRMPLYLKLPFALSVIAFNFYPVFKLKRPFHLMQNDLRRMQIGLWRLSRIGFLRNFVRFFDSFTILAWYSIYEKHIE